MLSWSVIWIIKYPTIQILDERYFTYFPSHRLLLPTHQALMATIKIIFYDSTKINEFQDFCQLRWNFMLKDKKNLKIMNR